MRSEPPPPPPGGEADPLRLLARRALRRTRRTSKRRKEGERRNGRRPFRPHLRFGKRRKPVPEKSGREGRAPARERRLGWPRRRRDFWKSFFMATAVVLVILTALPMAAAFAQEPEGDGWTSDEIEFQPPPEVPGQRLFVEELAVSGDRAGVLLRAATGLDLRVRAYGGPEGRTPRYYATASLKEGERARYDLPLDGPSPSLVFSWQDELGQAGAVSLDGERLPWPLPAVTGELCVVRAVSLGWTPGAVEGVLESACVSTTEERVDLQMVAGHADVTTTALLTAEVVSITGTVTVASGALEVAVAFVAGGQSRFRLPVGTGEAVHAPAIEAELEASLRIPLPPLVQLTHHARRVEELTETATVSIPAYGDSVTDTVTVPGEDGAPTVHSVTASCYVPASTVSQDVVFTVVHPERVEAEVVARAPIARSRQESLSLASSVWSDDAYRALTVPEAEPEPDPVRQTPVTDDELRDWFERLGWEWVW